MLYVESGGSRSRCAQRASRSRRCQHAAARASGWGSGRLRVSARVDPPSGRVPRSGRAHPGPRELVVSSGKYAGTTRQAGVGALARWRVSRAKGRKSSLQAVIKWPGPAASSALVHPLSANPATRPDLRLRAAGRPTRHFRCRTLRIAGGTGPPQRVVRQRSPDQPRTPQYRSTPDRDSSG